MPLDGEVPRGVLELAGVCDPDKEAREAEDKGSDEEDSGPDAEGEGDIMVLEAGGSEEREAKAKAAVMARVRSISNVAGLESKGRVRRLWDCVSCLFPTLLPQFLKQGISPAVHADAQSSADAAAPS